MPKHTITHFGTHLKVSNLDKSRKFYESLGFKPVFAYGDDEFRASLPKGLPSAPEKYRGMTFQVGDSALFEIAEGHIGVKNQNVFKETITDEKISAMVKVKSLIPLFSNPEVKLKYSVRKYYWGTIEAAFRDPDGYVLIFISPYSKAEFTKVSKYTKIEVIEPSDT